MLSNRKAQTGECLLTFFFFSKGVLSTTATSILLTFGDQLGLLTGASGDACCHTNNYLSGSNKCSCREFRCPL